MKSKKAASRYANSLLQHSLEKSQLEAVKADMVVISSTCASSQDLSMMLESAIIKTDVKNRALRAIFEKSISKLSVDFIDMLTIKKRESILEAVAKSFIEQYSERSGIVEAIVTSASALTLEEKTQLKSSLSSFGKTIALKELVDPTILGGVKIRVGDLRLDASIRKKLNTLKQEIHKS
jgi:F-type H+-transporting ATPase subunit delta